jgi:hypothetical protein
MSACISAVGIHEAGHAVAAIVATKELEVFQKRLSEALNSPRQECASISAIDIRFARARADLQQLCDGAGADLDLVRARQRKWGAARWRAERPNHLAPRIAASEEGVPAIFGGVLSLNLINSFATNRTKPNMNPPTAIPYITEADSQSQLSVA